MLPTCPWTELFKKQNQNNLCHFYNEHLIYQLSPLVATESKLKLSKCSQLNFHRCISDSGLAQWKPRNWPGLVAVCEDT